MKRIGLPCLLALLVVVSSPGVSAADAGLLRTAHALDEARGYCLDIAGVGATLRLDDALQAHTCKFGEPLDDQRFERAADGAIKASAYDRCLAAGGAGARRQAVRPRVRGKPGAAVDRRVGPPQPRLAARPVRVGGGERRDRGHAGAHHAGVATPGHHARALRRRPAGAAIVPLVGARRAGHQHGGRRPRRHAGRRGEAARRVRLRVRRRHRGADRQDLRVAAARLRAGRDQGDEEPRLRPARAAAGRYPYRDRAAVGPSDAGGRRVPRRRARRRQPRRHGQRRRLLREPGLRRRQWRVSSGAGGEVARGRA